MNNKQNKINLNNRDALLLIAGLGNTGEKYNKTRHNAGFIFLDELANQLNLNWVKNSKLQSYIIKSNNIILIKPMTYMNNSGLAVRAVMSYYKMLPKKLCFQTKNADLSNQLLVIHDDLDIELNKYKFSTNSRAAGNNGVQSIINHLKTKNFKRLRLGIRTDLLKHIASKDFVLNRFSSQELAQIQGLVKLSIEKDFEI